MQELITKLQKEFMADGCQSVMKEATLHDIDCDAIVTVFYDSISVTANGGIGTSSTSNYKEACEGASDSSYRNVQRQQNF